MCHARDWWRAAHTARPWDREASKAECVSQTHIARFLLFAGGLRPLSLPPAPWRGHAPTIQHHGTATNWRWRVSERQGAAGAQRVFLIPLLSFFFSGLRFTLPRAAGRGSRVTSVRVGLLKHSVGKEGTRAARVFLGGRVFGSHARIPSTTPRAPTPPSSPTLTHLVTLNAPPARRPPSRLHPPVTLARLAAPHRPHARRARRRARRRRRPSTRPRSTGCR